MKRCAVCLNLWSAVDSVVVNEEPLCPKCATVRIAELTAEVRRLRERLRRYTDEDPDDILESTPR